MASGRDTLFDVRLDEAKFVTRSPEVEHERRVAIYDLLEENSFRLLGHDAGPYALRLGLREKRLLLEIADEAGFHLEDVPLSLIPFRSIIRDYFTVCESYYEAIRSATPSKIEAIDMGRRGLHDEGAELLRSRLASSIEIDGNTARRLFTLICVLHVRG